MIKLALTRQNITELFSQLKNICYLEKNQEKFENLLYAVNNYEDVTLYFKHTIRDCQQEKAKREVLEKVRDNVHSG